MPPDRISLQTPTGRGWEPVFRLVLGGIADRLDLGFEDLDDIQLALEQLLAEAGAAQDSVQLVFEVLPNGIRTKIGPLREGALAEALQGPEPQPGELTLRRILETVVDSFGVEIVEGDAINVILNKRVRGILTPQRDPGYGTLPDRELLKRYHQADDTGAREALVERHLPLVRSLARRYAGRGESLEDIEQVGSIGLLKAIDRYDMEREVSLTTYATPNIVGEIKRHFRDKGWAIRVPRGLQELSAKMSGAVERLTLKLERSPTIAEIAADLQTTPEQVLEAMEAGSAYSTVSLSSGPGGDDDDAFDPMEAIGAEDAEYERTEQRAALEPALGALPSREREILRMRFEDGLTQTQIAERVGISQMHVSRLIRKSLARMRDQLT